MSETFGGYVLLEGLGRGATGVVYRARHVATGAERALKIITGPPDAELIARFKREAETLARAGGEGVVPIHEAGSEHGRPFLAMGLMPGGSLAARSKKGPRLEWREAVTLALEVARALERCHAAGIVHRDLKPANILFDDQGRPRLADFGIVRDLSASKLTETGTLLGTPTYMPPEQLEGRKVDGRADLYALGVILFELLAGRPPHAADSFFELVKKKSSGTRDALPGEPPLGIEIVLDRALAGRREARYQTATALVHDLEKVLRGEKPTRPRPRAVLVAIPIGALAIVVILLLVLPGGAPGPDPQLPAAARIASSTATSKKPPADDDVRALEHALEKAVSLGNCQLAEETLAVALDKHGDRAVLGLKLRPDAIQGESFLARAHQYDYMKADDRELVAILLAVELAPNYAHLLAERTDHHHRRGRISFERALAFLEVAEAAAARRVETDHDAIERARASILWHGRRFREALDFVTPRLKERHKDDRYASKLLAGIADLPEADLPLPELLSRVDMLVRLSDAPEAHLLRGRALRKTRPEEAVSELRVAISGVETGLKRSVEDLIAETEKIEAGAK